jgi:hypothetical protein
MMSIATVLVGVTPIDASNKGHLCVQIVSDVRRQNKTL